MIELRPYQTETLDKINNLTEGRYLIHLATGLGKTFIFSKINRLGKTLLLSHRDELVRQPIKYFDCPVGIEQGKNRAGDEEVISASVQSLVRRLDKFEKDYFHTIIIDECHHASSKTYQKIIEYFNFKRLLGFTATPNRSDNVGLHHTFDEIIISHNLKWGIENKWLSPIECMRVNIGYDLSEVATRLGDYSINDLDKALNIESANQAIAEVYEKYAINQTLIFAVNVAHAENISKLIPNSMAVTGNTKHREQIVEDFKSGKIKCLVNCMIFTEGTDFPSIETIIFARPTKSATLYTQSIGRGTRLYPGKTKCRLIDCVGNSTDDIMTAPSLIGVDITHLENKEKIEGDLLFDIPEIIETQVDHPRYWIKNAEIVSMWSRKNKYRLHGVDWYKLPSGTFILSFKKGLKWKITNIDELGNATFLGKRYALQTIFDDCYQELANNYADEKALWDKARKKAWGKYPASDKQKNIIKNMYPNIDIANLTKYHAGNILTRGFNR